MNLESRKLLLGVGLISLGTSFSSGDTSVVTSDIHASADWVNGDGGCINGEQREWCSVHVARSFELNSCNPRHTVFDTTTDGSQCST